MPKSNPICILYMEDDNGLARLMQRRMQREGFEVDLAADGQQGLAKLEERAYDLLLVDYKMPILNGLEVIRRLSLAGKLPLTVMVTGAGDEATAVEAMRLGAADYIVKDLDGGYLELMPVVAEKLLRHRQLVHAKEKAERDLREAYENLEKLVAERTSKLRQTNRALKRELSQRSLVEALLKGAGESLERQVEDQTAELKAKTEHLEELEVALKVLLQKRDEDRRNMEENLIHNVKSLILPHLEKLKTLESSARGKIHIEMMESHIHQITSPMARRLSSHYYSLTPTEIRIAGLIREDKSTKEIAQALNVSESAVIYHRNNIREKLGLKHQKINLRTHLQSFGQ